MSTHGRVLQLEEQVRHLTTKVLNMDAAARNTVSTIGSIHNDLRIRVATLETVCGNLNDCIDSLEDWSEELTAANNTIMVRLNAMESRQDPSCHNEVT